MPPFGPVQKQASLGARRARVRACSHPVLTLRGEEPAGEPRFSTCVKVTALPRGDRGFVNLAAFIELFNHRGWERP